jgi:hypothetical protein
MHDLFLHTFTGSKQTNPRKTLQNTSSKKDVAGSNQFPPFLIFVKFHSFTYFPLRRLVLGATARFLSKEISKAVCNSKNKIIYLNSYERGSELVENE